MADLVIDTLKLLDRAEGHRKAGELAPAVQAYLDVLDVDPSNAVARAALGPVLRAVRTVGRIDRSTEGLSIKHATIALLLAAAAFFLGYGFVCLAI